VRLSRILPVISISFTLMACSAFAQDKPDPRIYQAPTTEQNQQHPDYSTEPRQDQPDYRNQPEQQNPPDYRNQMPQQDPDYQTQPRAAVPPPPPARMQPPQNWTPDAVAYLRQNSSSKTEFDLDHSMVVLASKVDDNDPDLRRIVAGVDGISVHHFRFAGEGMYDPRILTDVRQQYRAAGWEHISASHARYGGPGGTDVWVRLDHLTIRNVAFLFAGPNQVNFVSVSCAISPVDLMRLGGHFGIPPIQGGVVIQGRQGDLYPPQQPGY
jgi:hypothetical protein